MMISNQEIVYEDLGSGVSPLKMRVSNQNGKDSSDTMFDDDGLINNRLPSFSKIKSQFRSKKLFSNSNDSITSRLNRVLGELNDIEQDIKSNYSDNVNLDNNKEINDINELFQLTNANYNALYAQNNLLLKQASLKSNHHPNINNNKNDNDNNSTNILSNLNQVKTLTDSNINTTLMNLQASLNNLNSINVNNNNDNNNNNNQLELEIKNLSKTLLDLDTRINRLERIIGTHLLSTNSSSMNANNLDDFSLKLIQRDGSICGILSRLDEDLSLLGTKFNDQEVFSKRLQAMINDMEQLTELRKRNDQFDLNINNNYVGSNSSSSLGTLESKINVMYSIFEQLAPMIDIIPRILIRLKTLRNMGLLESNHSINENQQFNLSDIHQLISQSGSMLQQTSSQMNSVHAMTSDLINRINSLTK